MNSAKIIIEDNILKGPKIPFRNDYPSLGKFVLDKLENNPDSVGQIDAVTGKKYTYKEIREKSISCALWMRDQDLLFGDVVAICSHNQLDISLPCFAALYLGVIFSPLDVGMSRKELCNLLKINEPKMAFVSEELATVVANAAKDAGLEIKIIVFGQVDGFLEFNSIVAEPNAKEIEHFRYTPIESPDAIAFIAFTSGTTGLPKAAAISHKVIIRQMIPTSEITMNSLWMAFTPLSWITGTLCILWSLCLNVTRLITPPFEEHSACELIEKYKVNLMLAAPNMINRLLKSGAMDKYDISSLKRIDCGGSSLTYASQEAFTKLVPNTKIYIGYGMTEIGGVLSNHWIKSKPGSCGHIVPNAELKVIDPDTGRILGANQQGELLIKTATMMNHYYRNPQATAKAIDDDGWFHSGDLGYYDEDGNIFVVDRLKDLIKYRGFHISPSDIESVILTHPGVKDVAVVSLLHPQDDEHPIALVVKTTNTVDTDNEVTEREIIDLVAAEMSDSKRLRGGVRFTEHIPRNTVGKIQHKVLRDLVRSTVTSSKKPSE